jgi:hypothetical protein
VQPAGSIGGFCKSDPCKALCLRALPGFFFLVVVARMIFLLLSILFLCIANLFQRYSMQAGANAYAMNAIARIFSGVVAIAAIVSSISFLPVIEAPPATLIWAAVGGTFYWLAGLGAIKAYGLGHVGISSTVLRCSMIIPTLASLIVWHDVHLAWDSKAMWIVLATLVLLMAGIFLSGLDQILRERRQNRPVDHQWLIWLLAAFLGQGCWEVSLRAAGGFPTEVDRQVYLAMVFLVAMVISIGTVVVMKISPRSIDIRFGCLLGLLATLATTMRPYAVRDLSGVVVFPMTAMGSMLLMNLASVAIWRTHLGRWGITGLTAAVLATILMCLR